MAVIMRLPYNPGLLMAFLLDVIAQEDIFT